MMGTTAHGLRSKVSVLLSGLLLMEACLFGAGTAAAGQTPTGLNWTGAAVKVQSAAKEQSIASRSGANGAYVEGEVLVVFRSGARAGDRSRLMRAHSLSSVESVADTQVERMTLPDGADVEETVEALKASGLVEHAQPNYKYYPVEAEPPAAADHERNWGLENRGQLIENIPGYGVTGTFGVDIGAASAWETMDEDLLEPVVVAVIDTGVDIHHPELEGRIWTNPGEIPGNGIDDDNNGYIDDIHGWDFVNDDNTVYDGTPDDDHGTHIASVIAGRRGNGGSAGVASNAVIMPLKILGEGGYGTTAEAILAVQYASRMGAKISNNSWGGAGFKDELLLQAVNEADMLFIAAAGNGDKFLEGFDTDEIPYSPVNLNSPNQINVAAVGPDGELASFSNYGENSIHLAAPGVAIYGALTGGRYGYMDGTSMAAPHAAGAAALAMGMMRLSVEETKQLLLNHAARLPSLAGKVRNGAFLSADVAQNVQELTVQLDNPKEFAPRVFEISFLTGEYGALREGKDVVNIRVEGMLASDLGETPEAIMFNGLPLDGKDLSSRDGGETLSIRVPTSVGRNEPVTIRFGPGTGWMNGPAGVAQVAVRTSADQREAVAGMENVKDPSLKVLRLDASGFPREMPSDGTVAGVVKATLDNAEFAGVDGAPLGAEQLSFTALPPGIHAEAVKADDTTVTITVYGHNESGSPFGLLIPMFHDAAFKDGDASQVRGATGQFVSWTYMPESKFSFANSRFIESDADDGSMMTSATAVLTRGALAGEPGTILDSGQVVFEGVPEGLKPQARLITANIVVIELTGRAERHSAADSVGNVKATFLDPAFTDQDVKPVGREFEFSVTYKDAPGKPSNLQAVQKDAKVELSWDAVPDAQFYVIMKADVDGRFYPYQITPGVLFTDVLEGLVPAQSGYRVDAYRGRVKTESDAVTVQLTADMAYFEGEVLLNGRRGDGTRITVRNEAGDVLYTAEFDAADPLASVAEDHGVTWARDEDGNVDPSRLFVYFYAPVGEYEVAAENDSWTAAATAAQDGVWMLGEYDSGAHLRLFHVGLIGTLVLEEPDDAEDGNDGGNGGNGGGNGNGGGGFPIFIPMPPSESDRPPSERFDGGFVYRPAFTEVERGGKTIAAVELTEEDIAEAVEAAGGDANGMLTIDADAEGAAEFVVPVAALANSGFETVEVRTARASYRLPISLLDPDELAARFGEAPGAEWSVTVAIHPLDGAEADRVRSAAAALGAAAAGDPIRFEVFVHANGRTHEYREFGVYVERTVTLSRMVNVRKMTAARFDPEAGTLSFVPATFRTQGGETIATIKRNGNSVYVLLELERSFADLAGHWAAADIHLLAGKLVLSGTGEDAFDPGREVTRAEFAAMLTRGLGLSPNAAAAAEFGDIGGDDWFAGAVGAAAAAGLVTGFEDGTFRPHERVTREQMAVMFQRAMRLAGMVAPAAEAPAFADRAAVSPWASPAVAAVHAAGIVGGRPDGTFAPGEAANRAEAAVMLKRLLQKAGLID